jgi:hypothetical protein
MLVNALSSGDEAGRLNNIENEIEGRLAIASAGLMSLLDLQRARRSVLWTKQISVPHSASRPGE